MEDKNGRNKRRKGEETNEHNVDCQCSSCLMALFQETGKYWQENK